MGWFSPSHCVDFCHSFFSNSMYRVTAREGTLLVMLRSKRGTEGSFAPHFPPPPRILPMQALHLDFKQQMARSPPPPPVARNARERVTVPAPTLCLAFRATEGFSCTHHPSLAPNKRQRARSTKACLPSQFRATEDFLTATLPLPPLETRDRGLVVPSISIFEQWRACSPIPCSNLARTVRQRVCSANAYPLS